MMRALMPLMCYPTLTVMNVIQFNNNIDDRIWSNLFFGLSAIVFALFTIVAFYQFSYKRKKASNI